MIEVNVQAWLGVSLLYSKYRLSIGGSSDAVLLLNRIAVACFSWILRSDGET